MVSQTAQNVNEKFVKKATFFIRFSNSYSYFYTFCAQKQLSAPGAHTAGSRAVNAQNRRSARGK